MLCYTAPRMLATRRAVIDVGTNSIKLLVAEVSDSYVKPLWEDSEQTRLGKGFYETHLLQADAMGATAYFARQFVDIARSYHASSIRIIATSAARDALNQAEFLKAMQKATGLQVDIIPGELEATYAYRGVISNPLFQGRLLIMDVGGGSAEFILGEGSNVQFAQSFKLGNVRLQELFHPSDPPSSKELQECRQWLANFFATEIRPALAPVLNGALQHTTLVGTGGATTVLARMENRTKDTEIEVIENTRISAQALQRRVEGLWSMMLSDRKRLIGLKKKKADVIIFGAAIYEASLLHLGFRELRVSTRGLRYAALLDQNA